MSPTHVDKTLAVQQYIIYIIAYGSPSESFFLEDETFVEDISSLLGRDAEVHIFQLLVTLIDEVAEQEIQCAVSTALLSGGYILHVCHMRSFEDHCACHYLLIMFHQIEFYLFGEALHEEFHLRHIVYRVHVMMIHEHFIQEFPVFLQCLEVPFRHAVDIETVFYGLFSLSESERAHLHGVSHTHHGTHLPSFQYSTCAEECIEFFCRGNITIYIRYRLHHYSACLQITLIIEQYGTHDTQHLGLSDFGFHYEPSVGKSLVGIHAGFALHPVGRKEGNKSS